MARKTKEESEKTRQSILDAAERVFLGKGLAMATMADIADAAQISRGAVYGHYKNKQEVVFAMCSRGFQDILDSIPLFKPPYCDQLLSLMMMFFRRAAQCSSGERVLEILYVKVEQHEENRELLRRRDVFEKRCHHVTRKLLRQAVKNGELPANLDIGFTNASLHALYHGICGTLVWYRKPDTIEWDAIARLVNSWRNAVNHCPQFLQTSSTDETAEAEQ